MDPKTAQFFKQRIMGGEKSRKEYTRVMNNGMKYDGSRCVFQSRIFKKMSSW